MSLSSLEKLDPFYSVGVLFPEYFQSISRMFPFPYYGIGQNYGNWIFRPSFTIFPKSGVSLMFLVDGHRK